MDQQKLELRDPRDCGIFGTLYRGVGCKDGSGDEEAYDFTMSLRGLVPGSHKIWLATPTLSRTIVPGLYCQKVAVDLASLEPAGQPKFVAGGP